MIEIKLPYGRGTEPLHVDEKNLQGILRPDVLHIVADEVQLVHSALQSPIGTPRLCELARGKERVLVITSDHTRPVPSRITLPILLQEIRKGSPNADICILIATGMHRATTPEEMDEKFGANLVAQEHFVNHISANDFEMADFGTLPSGGKLRLNNRLNWADLVVSEGFIEPHFFAGFSGGRKSILPGIASRESVLYNHCAPFIAHPAAASGSIEGNPIHQDMVFAAKAAKLAFILNVILDEGKRIVAAVAGDAEAAHQAGCQICLERTSAPGEQADIVVTTNGGYPLDQNVYQSPKGMSTGAQCVRDGGVLIMLSACEDGTGSEGFYEYFSSRPDAQTVLHDIQSTPADKTVLDQWCAQTMARVLCQCQCIFVAQPQNEQLLIDMHIPFARSADEALQMAYDIVGKDAKVLVIPDGVGTIVK